MNKYVLAVSGGVDSVVLLDMLSKQSGVEIILAHFDHGIRDNSDKDAKFVAELAKKYGYRIESKRENLGKKANEELARERRYAFLREVAKKYNAHLMTAHHAGDVIETIAINFERGTGWRGLSAVDSDIIRPLVHTKKEEILNYAKLHNLEWREDSTNKSDNYLRNRIRKQLIDIEHDVQFQLLGLWSEQKQLKKEIDKEVLALLKKNSELGKDKKRRYSRYFFIHIDEITAIECLRRVCRSKLTRPQLKKLLHMIKTAKSGKKFHAGGKIVVNFTSRNFNVELIK